MRGREFNTYLTFLKNPFLRGDAKYFSWGTMNYCYQSPNKSSIRLAWHLKVCIRTLAAAGREWIFQMMGPYHYNYTHFQSNLQVHDKVMAFHHLFFAAWPKMWFENWTLELEIIYHVLQSFENSASFFSHENN